MKSYLMYLWMMISVICTVSITGCGGGGGSSSSAGTAQAASDTFVKGITVTSRSASDTDGVVSIACATNEVVVGGGCFL